MIDIETYPPITPAAERLSNRNDQKLKSINSPTFLH